MSFCKEERVRLVEVYSPSLGASKPARWLKKLMFIASSKAWTVKPHKADSKPGKELKGQWEMRIFTCSQVERNSFISTGAL